MKTFVKSLLLAALALLNACSDVPDELGLDHEGYVHTAELRFDCGLSRFDAQTRATTSSWDDGARVYIQFLGNGRVSGYATYQKSTDAWTLYFGDALTQGQTAACEVYYFENPATSSSSSVTFTAESTVYADKAATYLYKNGVMTLQGHLKPQTGRVRFKGTAGQTFLLDGLKWYSAYDASSGSLSQTNGQMRLTIGANGYSQYVYADFNNSATRQLSITNGSEGTYEKSFSSNVLSVGKSGYISVPTQANHNGWKLSETETNQTFTVNGISFKMVKVEGGTFQMGGDMYDDEKPIHQVTLTNDYYIGETEVTQELWSAVMGSNPSYFKSSNKLPVEKVSWDDCQTFITKLNALTGKSFRLPTEAEWEFAARGGNASKGYNYSGSNSIGDVAWYDRISSSKTHEVATKAPNELGIYDMSGNVWEWCQDWYGSYSSEAQTNPAGPTSGSSRVHRGGSWYSGDDCRVADRAELSASYTVYNLGLRLALAEGQDVTSHTSAAPNALSFDASANSAGKVVTVTSNEGWTATSNTAWCKVSPASGTNNGSVTVTLTANTSSSSRTATVTIKGTTSGDATTINVVQLGENNANSQTFTVNGVPFNMVKVEGGTFQMGSTSGESNEKPVHQVTLANDYYIGETEVTQVLWTAVMGSNPSNFTESVLLPVEQVSWNDCQTFITKLNEITGLTFRLPTEAEWEFAACGGNSSKGYTYSGSNSIGDVAWYYDNCSSRTHEVATKTPNELGIYDMSGNVWEWCQDWYGSYSSNAQTNPTGPTSGSYRVIRGGSWSFSDIDCRVASRAGGNASSTDYDFGLRLAL